MFTLNNFNVVFFEETKTNIVYALDDIIPYYDITFVISGSLNYIIDKKSITVKAGDVIFIKPNSHRVRLSKSNQTVKYVSMNFFNKTDKKIELPTYIESCVTPNLYSILALMLSIYKDYLDEYSPEEIDSFLNIIFLSIKKHLKLKSQSSYITPILDYIRRNLTKRITIDDIAKEVHLSPAYCCHIINDEFNTTITEIINKERILLAESYILEKNKSLTEIAEICGFNSYSYFSRTFKKITGTTPNHYKI